MITNAIRSEKKEITVQKKKPHSFLAYAYSRTKQNTCKLELVENAKQYRELIKLRKEIFIKSGIYPFKFILNGLERQSVHFLAKQDTRYVGMISVKLDDDFGLPLEEYFNLNSYRKRRIVELGKLGVVNSACDRMVFYQLVGAAYAFVRFCGYDAIVMTTLKRLDKNNRIYTKMGFKVIADVKIYDNQSAYVMILDLNLVNGLMWMPTQLTKVAKRLIHSVYCPDLADS